MKIKKYFPMIALSLVSIAAAIISTLILMTSGADDLASITENFGSRITAAIVIGIALVFVIWVGAGIEYGLSFIPKNSHRILVSVLVFLFLPALCCFVIPAVFIVVIPGILMEWGTASAIFTGVVGLVVLLPATLGFFSIYLGAGTGFFSRWLANRIWPEAGDEGNENSINIS